MNTIQRTTGRPETLLIDFEKTSSAIRALEDLCEFRAESEPQSDCKDPLICGCRERLKQQLNEEEKLLDEYTRPSLFTLLNLEIRVDSYKGKRIYANPTDSYIQIMKGLTNDYPERIEDIQQALRRGARNRKILSRDPFSLFVNKHKEWIRAKNVCLDNGLYLDKNNDTRRKHKLLKAAVEAVGLKWGKDVVINWWHD